METPQTERVTLFSWFPLMFFTFFIVVLNLLIVVAFIVNNDIQQRLVNIMFCNQAIIDIFTASIFIPCYSASKYHTEIKDWNLNAVMYLLFVLTSLLNILLMTIEHYVKLRDEKFPRIFKFINKRIHLLLCVTWCLPLLLSVISCIVYKSSIAADRIDIATNYDVFIVILFIAMTLPIIALIILSLKIASQQKMMCQEILTTVTSLNEAVETENSLRKFQIDKQSVHTVLSLLICLTVSYLPRAVYSFMVIADKTTAVPDGVLTYVFVTKSLLNPVILLVCLDDYKKTVYNYLGGNRFVYPI